MKTVVITGANRGIGLSFAKYYKSQGYHVIGTARSPSKELEQLQVQQFRLDVTNDVSISEFAKQVGETRIDLLINNAGILHRDSMESVTRESMLEQFNVNAIGPLMCTKALLSNLQKDSKVVNITSSMGSIAENGSSGYYGYRASKTGLNMVTKCLALDLKPLEIPVLALHPGYIQTDMTNFHGDMGPDESVSRMAKWIEELTLETTGVYRHRDGRVIPY
jgi:NAD(P)-dependent dehydrogenase (short-subunit alcohol dehydrogenase family)